MWLANVPRTCRVQSLASSTDGSRTEVTPTTSPSADIIGAARIEEGTYCGRLGHVAGEPRVALHVAHGDRLARHRRPARDAPRHRDAHAHDRLGTGAVRGDEPQGLAVVVDQRHRAGGRGEQPAHRFDRAPERGVVPLAIMTPSVSTPTRTPYSRTRPGKAPERVITLPAAARRGPRRRAWSRACRSRSPGTADGPRTSSSTSVTAVTVAVRGTSRIRPISPKTSPTPFAPKHRAVVGDLDLTLDDDEELLGRIALGDDDLAGRHEPPLARGGQRLDRRTTPAARTSGWRAAGRSRVAPGAVGRAASSGAASTRRTPPTSRRGPPACRAGPAARAGRAPPPSRATWRRSATRRWSAKTREIIRSAASRCGIVSRPRLTHGSMKPTTSNAITAVGTDG